MALCGLPAQLHACGALPLRAGARARPARRPLAALSYRQEQQNWGSGPRPQPDEWPPKPLIAEGRSRGASASAEELQRCLDQVQAENVELQAEIRHLAATLRAALASGGAMMSGLDWGPPPPADGLEAAALEQLGGAPHSHAHYDAAGAGDGASWQQAGGTGAGSLSLPSVDVFEGLESGEPVPVPRYHQPPSVSQATLSCSMQHPGSICCSKLSSALDPGGAACTISLHTTARCTADDATVRRHLQPEELRALAAHALVGAAHAFSQAATAEYRSKTAPLQDVVAAHARLLHVLEHGVVICAERMPTSQFDHKSYLLTLQDPATARRVRAIYKPRVYGDADGWHRTPMEFVAYRLNLLLGLDLVPPTAYRSAPLTLSLGGEEDELCFQEGAMMLWVEDCKLLKEYPPHEWGVDPAVLLSDTRVLDVLLHNSDRHHGHFLLGPHWAKGRRHGSHWEGQPHPVLIDHAAAFRKEAFVSMDHENAFGSGPVRCVSASTYLRLRFLDSHTIAEELGAHLSRSEQRQLLHRRDYVLHYLDDLVASQGYGATVRE